MAKKTSKNNKFLQYIAISLSVLLVVLGGLAYWAHDFTSTMVKEELAAQKIYFPPKGSPALDPNKYPDLQKYAGELVDTPEEAKAYANGYIGSHLKDIADGKVYAEVSAEARQDPDNKTLEEQKERLFQGETLRALLLGNGYAFGTAGKVFYVASLVMFAGAILLTGLALVLKTRK